MFYKINNSLSFHLRLHIAKNGNRLLIILH